MFENPPKGWPQISASLAYDDPAAAIDFLTRAFGFEVRVSHADPGGQIVHAELVLGDGLIMLGSSKLDALRSPRALGGASTHSLYVFVDGVDAHCERARAAGAKLFRELEDGYYGHRTYGAEDGEGHLWFFGEKTRESGPEAEL